MKARMKKISVDVAVAIRACKQALRMGTVIQRFAFEWPADGRERERLQWSLYDLSSASFYAWLICQVIKLKWTNHNERGNYLVGQDSCQKMKLLIHVRLFPCKNSCFELESRNSEENISTKSWKKTARFIKVFPANKLYFQIPLLKLCHALKSCHLLLHNNQVSLHETWLWMLCMGKNVNRHFSSSLNRNFDIFVVKITDLNVDTSIILKRESHASHNETPSLCNSRWRW